VSWHLHRDPTWQLHGANRYEECQCGARRVSVYMTRLASPVAPGWPKLVDSHGVPVRTSGWVLPPEQGWTFPKYPS